MPRIYKMGSALSFMEMDGYIIEATNLLVQELEKGSRSETFATQVVKLSNTPSNSDHRCALAKKCAERKLQIGLEDYANRVFWLFSFVTTLHSLMRDESTSLHDALMRDIAFDAATGRVAVVIYTTGDGLDDDVFLQGSEYSENPTVAYIYDSVAGVDGPVQRHSVTGVEHVADVREAAVYVCDVRTCDVLTDLLEELMGAPGHYMCKMVDALERLTEGDRIKVVTVAELERVHTYVTRCAVAMCEDSTALLADIKRAVTEQCGTRVTFTPCLAAT